LTGDASMHHNYGMISYLKQLEVAADKAQVSLIDAFKKSGTPTSTFYRAKYGTDLQLKTAQKVEDAIKHCTKKPV